MDGSGLGGGGALRTVGGDSGIARPSFCGLSVDILGSTFDSSRVVVGEGNVDDDAAATSTTMESQLVRRFLPGLTELYLILLCFNGF